MHSHVRDGVVILALLGSIGLAAAQPTSMPPGTSPSARPGASQSGMLQLSAAQKSTIFRSVMKEKVKTPPPANLQISVGSEVPASIELYALPPNVVTEVPAAKSFKYTVAQNQVVLIDPTNMRIVEIIKQ